jgi:hypothetical protein
LLASALGVPAVVEVYPGSFNEHISLNVSTTPLVGVTILFQGLALFTSPDGTPQIDVFSTTPADNAKLQGFQILGPVFFQRTDNATAVRVAGAADPTPGHTSACGLSAPFVMRGARFSSCGYKVYFLGSSSMNVDQEGEVTGNEVVTCPEAVLLGKHLNTTITYVATDHVAEGRIANRLSGRFDRVFLNGAPNLETDGSFSSVNIGNGLAGLACYNSGSIVVGPSITVRGRQTDPFELDFPADDGFAKSSLNAEGANLDGGAILGKSTAGAMVANLRGVTCPAIAVFQISGAQMTVDLRGSSAPVSGINATGGVKAMLSSFIIPGVTISAAGNSVPLPFAQPDASYTAIVSPSAANGDVGFASAQTASQVSVKSTGAPYTGDILIVRNS